MKAVLLAIMLVLLLVPADSSASAQTTTPSSGAPAQGGDPAITATGAIGEVKVIDSPAKQLIIKTDAGAMLIVTLSDKTVFKRLAPGEKNLTNAATITFPEVGEGDRVWARGKVADDHKSVPATALIVMNKADIAKKQDEERAEWKRRGILGIITALKPETKEITIQSKTFTGQQTVVVPVSDKVEMKRYAPDSIKFADAKMAKFEELKVGDQVRALGDKSPDGTSFTPEKVVTGSFRMVSGVVTAVDAGTGEVKINDSQTKQPLTIVVKQDAVLRKFPPASEMAGLMMMMGRGGQGAAGAPAGQAPGAGQGAARPQPGGAQGAPGGSPAGGPGGMRMGGGGPNVQDMIERLPLIGIADVKVGDTIIVSSTKGADPTRLTAISLISGADTLLTMLAAREQQQAGGRAAPNPAGGLGAVQFGIGLP